MKGVGGPTPSVIAAHQWGLPGHFEAASSDIRSRHTAMDGPHQKVDLSAPNPVPVRRRIEIVIEHGIVLAVGLPLLSLGVALLAGGVANLQFGPWWNTPSTNRSPARKAGIK